MFRTCRNAFLLVSCIAIGSVTPLLGSSIVPVGPFTGSISESFESFPLGWQPIPMMIFDGKASVVRYQYGGWVGSPGIVYHEGGWVWGAGKGVIDGTQARVFDVPIGVALIEFDVPVTAFGAYLECGSSKW